MMPPDEIIDVEIPLPPGVKRKQNPNDEDIPLPPGVKKKAVSVDGNPALPNGSPTFQGIEVPITDFGASQLMPSLNISDDAELPTSPEGKAPNAKPSGSYQWDRPTAIVGRSGQEEKGTDHNPLIDIIENIKINTQLDPRTDPLTKIATESYLGGTQMFLQGTDELAKSATKKPEDYTFWNSFELPAALVKTAFGGASMVMPQLQAFNAAFTGAEKIFPSEMVGRAMSPYSTILNDAIKNNGSFAVKFGDNTRFFNFSSDDLKSGAELADLFYQILIFHGANTLASKVLHNTPLTPKEANEATGYVNETMKDAMPVDKETLSKIPEDISDSKKAEVIPLVEKKKELLDQKEKVDDAFHPKIDEEIKAIDEKIQEKVYSNVPEQKTKTEVTEEGGVRTELPVNDVPIVPETIEKTVTENIQTDLPKTKQDAIQEPPTTESMLRNEGIRREGELSGVVEGDQPKVTTEVSSEVKPQKEIADDLIVELKNAGFKNVDGSQTVSGDHGTSTYVIAEDTNRKQYKFRISDHGVESAQRMKTEYHIDERKAGEQIPKIIEQAEKDAFPERFDVENKTVTTKKTIEISDDKLLKSDKIISERIASTGKKHYTVERTYTETVPVKIKKQPKPQEEVIVEQQPKAEAPIADTKAVDEVIIEPKIETNEKAKEASQEAEVLTETPKSEKVTEVSATTEPPLAESPNPEMTGITHAQTNEAARALGLPEYEKSPETFEKWDAEANKRIENGEMNAVLDKLKANDIPTPVEQRMMAKYAADLIAKIEKTPTDELINQYADFKKLADVVGGRLAGQTLVSRKGQFPVDDSLAGFFVREREANNDAPLTETQKSRVQVEYEGIKKAQEEWLVEKERIEAENAKLKSDLELARLKKETKKPKQPRTKEDYEAERKEIVTSISDKIKKIKESLGKTGVIFDPKVEAQRQFERDKILLSIAPDIGKLVKSHIQEGINKLGDIVVSIHEQLKDQIDGLTKKDIHNVIAGEYAERKKPRNEIAESLFDLREEAKLINRLENLQNGIEPKNERQKIKRNQEIETLRTKIKDFKDEAIKEAREEKEQIKATEKAEKQAIKNANKKTPEQIALQSVKKRLDTEIAKVEKELASTPIEKTAKKAPIKLDKEAQEKRDKLIRLKQDREVRLMQQQYTNRNKYQRAVDKIVDVLNVPRTIMSSMDFSAPLRQGIIASIANPKIASKAFVEMFKQAVSQKRFDRWFHEVKDDPRYEMSRESGLYVADPHDPRLTAKEEAFMNNLAERIPGAGVLIKGSERAYVGFLNKMRWDIFNRFADEFEASGRTFENSPELYKATAEYINNTTGRGNLGKLESVAPIINTALFSPRLIASRLNLLNPLYYAKLPKELRMQALKDMAKFIGLGMTVLALADIAGAEVEKDPRSSDFGKIKVGNTRWDIWGGFQQYIRVLTQLFTGQSKSANTGNINELSGEGAFGRTRGDVGLSFVRGKLAPIPSIGADLLAGKTIMGEEVTLAKEAESHLLPLNYSGIKDAVKDKGVQSIFTVGIPSTFGVGVQTYLPRGYDDVNRKDPTYKFLYDKKLNLTEPNQGEMNDADYKKFIPERKGIFKEEWDNVIKFGAHISDEGKPTVDEDATQIKPVSELTQDELSDLMKSIGGKATREAKKQFESKTDKPKSNANSPTLVR